MSQNKILQETLGQLEEQIFGELFQMSASIVEINRSDNSAREINTVLIKMDIISKRIESLVEQYAEINTNPVSFLKKASLEPRLGEGFFKF